MMIHFINLNNFLEKEYFSKFCLESWKKYMQDAEIKIWTENDEFIQKVLNKNSKFLEFFSKNKNYGFLCDYLRLHLQYEFGGIYSELDQILLKPIKIDENIEFCQSITIHKSITTSCQPNYFKKGNKILKYLIDELDNNFDEYWLHYIEPNDKFQHPFYGFDEWSLCALRDSSSILTDISELKINSLKFIKENGNWCLHLSDWWLYYADKILVIDYNQIEDYYINDSEYNVYIIFCKNLSSNNMTKSKCIFVDLEQKDIFLKFLKYKIFKSPELKNKFIDVIDYLGDINEISEKDFEL